MPNTSASSTIPHAGSDFARLEIFSPAKLRTDRDINTAVKALEDALDDSSGSFDAVIQSSLQSPHYHAFGFILSNISERHASRISKIIFNHFLSDIEGFYNSNAYKAILALVATLERLSFGSCGKPDGLDNHLRHSKVALTALDELRKLIQGLYRNTNANKRSPKRSMASGPSPLDVQHSIKRFEALGLRFPRTRLAAEETIQSTLETQRRVLRFFFRIIRVSDIPRLIREAYLFDGGNHDLQISSISERFDATLLQADLRFESAPGYGKWQLLCSDSWLRALARDGEPSRLVLKKLQELSFGHFSGTNQKRITRDSPIDIFRARLPGNRRLVYHIDIIPESDTDCETQVLRIIGIYRLNELERRNWDAVGKHQARRGKEYVERCRARSSCQGQIFDPVTFGETASGPTEGILAVTEDAQEDTDTDEIRRLLDLERYSILSQSVVRDVLEGQDRSHIFQLSRDEKKIIERTTSTFVIGRSGTGKTTVILFKMLGIERAWKNQIGVGPRPRQIFITKSRRLADKVEEEYVNFLFSLGSNSDMSENDREHIQRWSTRKMDTFDPDDGWNSRDDLPRRYSQLLDSDFPLFVTLDMLYCLLEADMRADSSESQGECLRFREKGLWYSPSDLLTFDIFKSDYWPHLPQYLTKGISPTLAFSDFIGLIKGSENSRISPSHILDKDAYQSLRRPHTTDYALFEAYEKLKQKNHMRDPADRTHALLDTIRDRGLPGPAVDYVYVDEVQDLLLIDTQVILSLCQNPDGFLWAGDTAQTVSVGSMFTFRELGASIWKHQRSSQALRRIPRQPETFQLLKNYRSHSGIVRCANVILDLLRRFPGAIDPLQAEAGVVGRQLPEFFHSRLLPPRIGDFFFVQPDVLATLGSNQCTLSDVLSHLPENHGLRIGVIVRDERSRQNFKTQIGCTGIILTLFGSKGLEYDDVILFNFFEGSARPDLWQRLIDTDHQDRWDSDQKLLPLIHELKCLYVAITRARHRLWIIDSTDEYHPLMRFLLDSGFVVEPPFGCNSIQLIAEETNPEEWLEEGKRLLDCREFGEAIMAFRRAGNAYMVALATARHLRQVARETSASTPRQRRDAFAKAGGSFERCSNMTENPEQQRSHYAAGARCYAEVKLHRNAVKLFELAMMHTEAALHCFHNNLLDEAVTIIKKDGVQLDPGAIETITHAARLRYLETKRIGDAAELFQNDDEMMGFVVRHYVRAARALVLERQGKYGEAIKQHFEDDQAPNALDLFLRHIQSTSRDAAILNTITNFLWRYLSFGRRTWKKCAGVPMSKIVTLLGEALNQNLGKSEYSVISIFKLVLRKPGSPTHEMDRVNTLLDHGSLDQALQLLALDSLFDKRSTILDCRSRADAISALRLFHRYSALVKEVAASKTPWKSPWVCTLFQIKEEGGHIRIVPETFLYECSAVTNNSKPADKSGTLSSQKEFGNKLRMLLSERLRTRLMEADDIITSHLSMFNPDMWWASDEKRHDDHAAPQPGDGWFSERVRFHLLRIIILDNLYNFSQIDNFHSRIREQRRLLYWLKHTLQAPAYTGYFSVEAALSGDMIPESRDGFFTIKRWAFGALKAFSRSRGDLLHTFDAGSYHEVTNKLKKGWPKTADLDGIRNAVSIAIRLLELISDPTASRHAWDGLTLYWLQDEDAIFPRPDY